MTTQRTGGQLLVDQLLEENVKRVFCVPGESYLAVMDAMVDVADQIDLISCRHESGAAMMAVASGHLSGEPGLAFVTRGPGATNASIAVHIAQQASIPLVLGVGQVAVRNIGRESFQEVDFEAYFAPIAKHVQQIEDPNAIPQAMRDAFATARSGRQGPVVLAFPEDVLSSAATARLALRTTESSSDVDNTLIEQAAQIIDRAARPLIIVGGGPWKDDEANALQAFAKARQIPVLSAFRRADIFDNQHECYGGFLGYGAPEPFWQSISEADCVIAFGCRLDEPTTRDYAFPRADQTLIHVYPEPAQIGRNFVPKVGIEATAGPAARAFSVPPSIALSDERIRWRAAVRERFEASESPPESSAKLKLDEVMRSLNAAIPSDAIITTDAGNFSAWALRYRRYTRPGRLIAPINGAMGYGVPAAIAAALAYPERCIIGCVGDGGMLMTGMEIASAVKYGAKPIILVFNNSKYGTIEMHQQRRYPGREIGNDLHNPDFGAFARSFGAFGVQVDDHRDFAKALSAARDADCCAVIELVMGPEPA